CAEPCEPPVCLLLWRTCGSSIRLEVEVEASPTEPATLGSTRRGASDSRVWVARSRERKSLEERTAAASRPASERASGQRRRRGGWKGPRSIPGSGGGRVLRRGRHPAAAGRLRSGEVRVQRGDAGSRGRLFHRPPGRRFA